MNLTTMGLGLSQNETSATTFSFNIVEVILILLVFALVFLPVWVSVRVLKSYDLSGRDLLLYLLLTWLIPWLGPIIVLFLLQRRR